MDTRFKPVTQRHDKVIIVAGGNSLRGFNLDKLNIPNVVTIAVNKAVEYFNADYFCTIDRFAPATIKCYPKNCYKFIGFKEPIFKGFHNLKRYIINHKDQVNNYNFLLCEQKDMIQTHNSAYAAFNLAYHFEPIKVLLLGVDADQSPHFYDDINNPVIYNNASLGWKNSISKIPLLFEKSLPQINKRGIKVINGSLHSLVNCFDKMSIEDSLDWIKE